MAMYQNLAKWLLKVIICFQLVPDSLSLVHMFQYHQYNGFLGTLDLGNQYCKNLPSLLRYCVNSLRTDDCIMIYNGWNCGGNSYRLSKGEYPNLDIGHWGGPPAKYMTISISRCKSTSVIPTNAHVQFYSNRELVLDIKNLCGRVNIAPHFEWVDKIDNNENCIILHMRHYTAVLQAGKSIYSEDLYKITRPKNQAINPIQGISPCYTNTTCNSAPISMSASVSHFTVTDPKIKSVVAKTSDLSMAATTTFINDGWATVSQEYKATKSITETTEVNLIKSFSKMTNWNVGASFELNIKAGSWLYGFETSIGMSLSTSYTKGATETYEQSHTRRYEVSREFLASQKIEIEPCTKYKVDSYVRVKERCPLWYNVTFEVTGKKGEKTMTAKELKQELGELNYIRDMDLYTVVASEVGKIYLDFGIETIVDGEGEIIVECRDKQLKTQPVVSYLNVSLNALNTTLHN